MDTLAVAASVEAADMIFGIRLEAFVSGVLGAVLGAVITVVLQGWITKSHRKEQIALDALNHFLDIYGDIGDALYFLGDVTKCVEHNPDNENKVSKVGDWMNLVAFFYSRNLLNRKIIDQSGIVERMREFCCLVTCSTKESDLFSDVWKKDWSELDSLCNPLYLRRKK